MSNSNGLARVLSEWQARGDWRLFFLNRDEVAKVTPADVTRVAQKYFLRSNRTAGVYLPTDHPERADIPPTPDVEKLVKDYKGGEAVASGEFFDPSAENIQKRTTFGELATGVKTAVLPKKTRGELATFELTLRYGNADSLKGQVSATQFLGTLMTRGTKKHSRQEIEDMLDKLKAKLDARRQRRPGDVQHRVQARVGPGGAEPAGRDAARADVPGRRVRRAQAAGARLPWNRAAPTRRRWPSARCNANCRRTRRTTFATCRPSRNRWSGWRR